MTQQANIGLPNRPFRISNVSPSANIFEDDQYMANLIDQHLALSSSGRSRKVSTISQPILTEDISLFNNAGFLPHQIRRSETSYPYAYKPSGNLQAKSGVQLRNTSTCTDDFHEELPININHLRRQQTKGIKKTIKSISKTRVLDPCAQSMESAVQLDHCQRLAAPHPIRYKISS
ncbi:unnamed protein product [Adineta ricciae]|uniref:Uncharacterized protein n=2 Tax=Adineta ricciae TaxID=249248 RepID=A0A814UDL1_ADIRI|nr:unnamed protein product [Adineta ricciae]